LKRLKPREKRRVRLAAVDDLTRFGARSLEATEAELDPDAATWIGD